MGKNFWTATLCLAAVVAYACADVQPGYAREARSGANVHANRTLDPLALPKLEQGACDLAADYRDEDVAGWVTLTAPTGCAVSVYAEEIIVVHHPYEGAVLKVKESRDYAARQSASGGRAKLNLPKPGGDEAICQAQTQVRLHEGNFWVCETPEYVADKMPEKRQLTLADGFPMWVKPGEVFAVHSPVRGTAALGVKSQIRVHDGNYFIRETRGEAIKILAAKPL
jgi:hypothetical protein